MDEVTANIDVANPELQTYTSRFISFYAKFIVKHSILVIILSFLLCGGISLFALKLKIDSDPNSIWVNPSSKIYKQKLYYESKWGKFYRLEQVFITFPNNQDNTIIRKQYLREVKN